MSFDSILVSPRAILLRLGQPKDKHSLSRVDYTGDDHLAALVGPPHVVQHVLRQRPLESGGEFAPSTIEETRPFGSSLGLLPETSQVVARIQRVTSGDPTLIRTVSPRDKSPRYQTRILIIDSGGGEGCS